MSRLQIIAIFADIYKFSLLRAKFANSCKKYNLKILAKNNSQILSKKYHLQILAKYNLQILSENNFKKFENSFKTASVKMHFDCVFLAKHNRENTLLGVVTLHL